METLNYTCLALFELKEGEKHLSAFDKEKLCVITPIQAENENTLRYKLEANKSYAVVCSTEISKRAGDFFLSVYFNQEFRDVEIKRVFHPEDRNLAGEHTLPDLIPELAEH